MKLKLTVIAAALGLTACTATPEMIEAQKDRCTQVGYTPGTTKHAECTERGTAQQQSTQNAAAVGAGAAVAHTAILSALW